MGGAVTIELFDGLGRRVQRDVCSAAPVAPSPYDCPAGTVQKRESWFYDGLGRVVATQVHALGQAAGDALTRIEYDGLGNRSSVWNGDAGTWHFERDLAGRLTVTTRPDGVRIASTYDQGGRLLRHRGPATTLAYRYWNAGPGIGKVRRIGTRTRRARVVRTFTYDVRGRLGEETWMVVVRGETAQRWTARYRYDELNRRVAIEYPTEDPDAAEIVETGFNEYGDAVSLSSSRATYVAGAAYDTYGRLIRIDYGNGLSDRLSYDPWSNARSTNGRLQCLRTTRTDAPGSACEPASDDPEALWYRDYDANGNLLEVADLAHSAAERFYDGRTYAYDAVGRLSQATYGDGTSENFEFDPLGNLLRKGNSQFAYTDPSSPSRLSIVTREGATSATYTTEFDANGSRTRGGDTRYEHDDMLRLTAVSVAGETVTAYGYDDSGHRIYRYDAASDTLRYELGDLVAIQGGNIDRMFYFGDRLVAVDRVSGSRSRAAAAPSQRLFLHPDHQGTPRLVTDGNGNVVEHARFGAFGERRATFDASGRPLAEPRSDFGFTGHREEREAELLFLGSRYYDPATGSFLTLDPAFQFASPYAYSDGNPVLGNDPGGGIFGLTALELVVTLTGSAAFIDSLVQTGDLGHSLTAGISAGFSVYASHQLSVALAKPLAQVAPTWAMQAAAVASEGFQIRQALSAIDEGQVASGVVSIGLLAGSLIGIETANDPGPGGTPDERYANNGIADRGVENGTHIIEVNGICATRPGCVTNFFTAAGENLSVLLGNELSCVNGCAEVQELTRTVLEKPEPVRWLCNSFGAIKCARAMQELKAAASNDDALAKGLGRVSAQLSGAPLLRPPKLDSVTYQANLFDPVVWVGTVYSVPLRSDVVLGTNWWVPVPLVVHNIRLYEKPLVEVLGNLGQ